MTLFGMEIDPWYLLAQAIGVIAATVGILSFQQKKQSGIVLYQAVNCMLWMVHMFMLGAVTGGFMNLIGVTRGIVFYYRGRYRWADSRLWIPVFCVLAVVAGAFSWVQGDGWLALLPMSAMVLTTFSLSLRSPFRVRALTFFSSPCWCTYNVIKGSIPGILTEIFVMVSIVIGILRFDVKRKTNHVA